MWLEVLSGEDAGRIVEVDRPLVLGRVAGVDLVVRDARASRRHLELTPGEDGLRLVDLDSANGTLVDDQPAREVTLRGGEEIRIGAVRIAVLAEEPSVVGAAVEEPDRPPEPAQPEQPTWSMIGRLVESRTQRGRRLTYAALAIAGVAAAALAVLAVTGTFGVGGDDKRVADVVDSVAPATVRVEVRSGEAAAGVGSGWALDREAGLIVTAAHVINPGQRFFVGEAEAEVVAANPCADLAVLRIPNAGGATTELRLGDAGPARQGETVLAFGYPESATTGEPASSTRGVISAASSDYSDPAPDVPGYTQAIRTDTALDPGFSGGPLVDLEGRLVGINAAVQSSSGGRELQGANYAVAVERARAQLEELSTGRSTAWIGASLGYPTTDELASQGLPPGLWIRGVIEGSAAAEAGLREGDYIVAVGGRPLDGTLSGWCGAAGGLRSGDTVELQLDTPDGAARDVDVRIP